MTTSAQPTTRMFDTGGPTRREYSTAELLAMTPQGFRNLFDLSGVQLFDATLRQVAEARIAAQQEAEVSA